MQWVIAYITTLAVFLGVDAVWLAINANSLYRATLGDILLPSFRVAPALVFYPVYSAGIIVFAVSSGLQNGSWQIALVRGALFGCFAYGLYDFTNLSTLRNWTLGLSIIDVVWGSALTGMASAVGFAAASYFSPNA